MQGMNVLYQSALEGKEEPEAKKTFLSVSGIFFQ